jgi:hypothetical protein
VASIRPPADREKRRAAKAIDALRVAARAQDAGAGEFSDAESPNAEFPGNDAPLEIPAEIERLQRKAARPVRA